MSDRTKPRLSLVPLVGLLRVAAVMALGLRDGRKPGDWQRMTSEDFREALLRHVERYASEAKGEDHLAALAANALILLWFEDRETNRTLEEEDAKPVAAPPLNGAPWSDFVAWYGYPRQGYVDDLGAATLQPPRIERGHYVTGVPGLHGRRLPGFGSATELLDVGADATGAHWYRVSALTDEEADE